jgi:glycosyltransferase involved in cell wall biosynthesis
VLNQTFKDIELICVNDGSTDNTLEILNEYAAKDSRLKVFDRANSGASAATNFAVDRSSGGYMFFMDHDDFLDLNYFEVLNAETLKNNYDMVFGGIKEYYGGSNIKNVNLAKGMNINPDETVEINDENRYKFFSLFYKCIVVHWGRLIKRSVIMENGIRLFTLDMTFTALTLLYAKKIVVNESVSYYYRQTEGSLSKKVFWMVSSCLKDFTLLKKNIKDRGFKDKEYEDIIDAAVCDTLVGYYDRWNIGLLSRCSLFEIRNMLNLIKDSIDYFNLNSVVNASPDKFLKVKYALFRFWVKNNIVFMPKVIRIARNIIRTFWFFK